jgi:hypothetical protein
LNEVPLLVFEAQERYFEHPRYVTGVYSFVSRFKFDIFPEYSLYYLSLLLTPSTSILTQTISRHNQQYPRQRPSSPQVTSHSAPPLSSLVFVPPGNSALSLQKAGKAAAASLQTNPNSDTSHPQSNDQRAILSMDPFTIGEGVHPRPEG